MLGHMAESTRSSSTGQIVDTEKRARKLRHGRLKSIRTERLHDQHLCWKFYEA